MTSFKQGVLDGYSEPSICDPRFYNDHGLQDSYEFGLEIGRRLSKLLKFLPFFALLMAVLFYLIVLN